MEEEESFKYFNGPNKLRALITPVYFSPQTSYVQTLYHKFTSYILYYDNHHEQRTNKVWNFRGPNKILGPCQVQIDTNIHSTQVLSDTLCTFAGYFKEV